MFDHHSRAYADGWRDLFATAHASSQAVISSDLYGGYYVLTRYADVAAAATDTKGFSSLRSFDENGADVGLGISIPPRPARLGCLEMDPPESLMYRRILTRWLTRGAVERGRDRVRQIATWAVDQVIEDGACEAMSQLISIYQRVLLLDLLGLPLDRWLNYKSEFEKSGAALSQGDAEADGNVRQAQRGAFYGWLHGQLEGEVLRQRESGGDGLVATLATAKVGDQPMDPAMATELLVMLFGGGEDTTVGTIASAVLYLGERPDERRLLTAEPERLPAAVEEIMRYYAPGTGMSRTVLEARTIGDHEFRPGDRVLLSYPAANLDPSVFKDPLRVDLARQPNPHLTFGAGAHRCLGAVLAQVSVESFLGEFLRRVPDYSVAVNDVKPAYEFTGRFFSYNSMPIRFTPGKRSGGHPNGPALTAERIHPTGSGAS